MIALAMFTHPSYAGEDARNGFDRAHTLWEALQEAETDLDIQRSVLELLGRSPDIQEQDEIAAARQRLEQAEREVEAAIEAADLADLQDRLRAAQAERDGKVESLIAPDATYHAAAEKRSQAEARIEAAQPRLARKSQQELRELAALALEIERIDRKRNAARRAWWHRGEVRPLYQAADRLWNEFNRATGRDDGIVAARQAVTEARRALDAAIAEAIEQHEPFDGARQALEQARQRHRDLRDELAGVRRALIGERQWHHEVMVPQRPRRGQDRPDRPASLWLPPDVEHVRGVIVSQPPALGPRLLGDPWVRMAAADQGLAIIRFEALDALFDYSTDTPERFQDALDALAEKAGHPELAGAPILALGHSVSGIFARNIAYWQPDRTIGVIHIKSGNMHQHRPDPQLSLAGVPFLAINGEFEQFGPEGGIRPAYGRQTQWVMIREQMLRFRRDDPAHLMSLLVHPTGDHGDWSTEMSHYCALFIRKAAQQRIPDTQPAGDGPIACLPIDPERGWLTDARLSEPRHAPAPYAEYQGDRADAFWHLDQDLAEATHRYHEGRLLLPDPTLQTPIPDDWPPQR